MEPRGTSIGHVCPEACRWASALVEAEIQIDININLLVSDEELARRANWKPRKLR